MILGSGLFLITAQTVVHGIAHVLLRVKTMHVTQIIGYGVIRTIGMLLIIAGIVEGLIHGASRVVLIINVIQPEMCGAILVHGLMWDTATIAKMSIASVHVLTMPVIYPLTLGVMGAHGPQLITATIVGM